MEGPTDAEAAMVMGNSTTAWDRFYDMRFQQRGAASAVAAMTQWRQGMLGHSDDVVDLIEAMPDLDVNELD